MLNYPHKAINAISSTASVNRVFLIHSIGIPLIPYVAPAIAPANKALEQLQPPALIVCRTVSSKFSPVIYA